MLEPGQTLGRYRVEAQLGAGGMGEVYRAWDSTLQRWIALKVVAKGDGSGRAERLLGEARAAAALRHPNIVSVFDVGEARLSGAGDAAEYAFVSMDLVEGRPLRDYVGDKSVSPDKQLAWLLQIASALRAAHKAGLVHRDVKPDNVMIATEGEEARVLDFGLAKAFTVDVQAPTAHEDAHAPPSFRTGEGRVIGTPAYMAPEQLAGGPPSPAWDQYSWGVLGCELLTGQHPRVAGLISMNGWVKAESLSHVPAAVAQVVARAMAPSPDQRFPSMDAVVTALGGPSSGALPVPATSSPPSKSISTSATVPVNIAQIGDTLATPVHPNAPKPQTRRRALPWVMAASIVAVAGSVLVWWRLHPRDTPSVLPMATASIAVTALTPAAPAATTSVASVPASVSAAPSFQPSAVTTTTHASPPVLPVRKLVVSLSASPTLQYDRTSIDRVVGAARFATQMCMDQHPPQTLPAALSVNLELWNLGNDMGKVRDVRVTEPQALASCLREAFMGLGFGPPKSATVPPGSIFVTIRVNTQ